MSSLSNLMRVARESIDGTGAATDEELGLGAADTTLTADVITEVEKPAAELDAGLIEVGDAEATATSLDNTAAMLTESANTGNGVDPLAAEMAADKITAAAERFSLEVKGLKPARESFATTAGRRAVTLSLAREAEDTAKSLRERAMAAIQTAIKWLKDLFASVFDKATRITNRAKSLLEKAKKAEANKGDVPLKMNISFLGVDDAVALSRKLIESSGAFTGVENALVEEATKDIDLNPGLIGSVELKLTAKDGKYSLVKNAPEAKVKEGVTLSTNSVLQVCENVGKAAGVIKAAKKSFDKLNSELNTLYGALKNANAETGVSKGRGEALNKAITIPRAAGALSGLLLNTASRLLDLADKSLSVNAKPAKA